MNASERPGQTIAIIGIGCRFPGGAKSPHTFWELLTRGGDGIIEVPRDRWNLNRFHDPNPAKAGKMYVRAGGFLTARIDQFDALFFGMSPREAAYLDPQQRLLLEVAWEAIEDAGLVPERLAGSDTGVYIGAFMLDHLVTQLNPLNRDLIGTHTALGSTMSILSNRISYVFDFRGPSMSIDTACSSSLVALHQACQAIWRGECSLALVGGVNIMYRPETPISMCKGGFLSPDGRCKSFDGRGDGYGRGEGAGIIVLKPFSAAVRDSDEIYAVVRGTGVNQDGHTDGITVPNPEAQEALIRRVCADAGVDPRWIRYVEAHGTGTAVGDPIEAAALGAVLGQDRSPADACIVGSVKANIGHLEAASGIAGVIKAALCLKHRQIPPLANLETPNPKIPFAALGLRLPRSLEPMPHGDIPACVSINSFGYGGTNAHAILQEVVPERRPIQADEDRSQSLHLLPISARSQNALDALVRAYEEWLGVSDVPPIDDICYSAAVRRGHHEHRLALIADSSDGMRRQLRSYLDHGPGKGMAAGSCAARGQKPVFVFTGMGPQWWAMARELLEQEPVFRQTAEASDAIFQRLAGWSVLTEMMANETSSRMAETQIAQPANFIVQVGLTALWRSWGVEPAAIVGHSVGEVTAAYVAGVLDLEDAIRVSYERSRIQKKAAGLGAMLAVGLSEAEIAAFLAEYQGQVSLAAANSPTSVTLSGHAESLQELAARLQERGAFNRFLRVEVAYHSPYMDSLLPELLDALQGLRLRAPAVPLYSTVSGELAEPGAYGAAYWCDNVRQPVYFARAMSRLIEAGHRIFLEVGPHPVLSTSIKECLSQHATKGTVLASLRREQPERRMLLEALAGLYVAGSPIDWSRVHQRGGTYVRLPSYPWQRETYWQEAEEARFDRVGSPEHALLGQRLATPEPSWQSRLNGNVLRYVAEHRVEEMVVLPGAAYVELGLAVHHEVYGRDPLILEELEFHKALVVEEDEEPVLHVRYDEKTREYTVYSHQKEGPSWNLHARGKLSLMAMGKPACMPVQEIQARCSERIEAAAHYQSMRERGLQYGRCFQGVRRLWRHHQGREVLAWIEADEIVADTDHRHILHPTLLDACFQALLATVSPSEDSNVYVPVQIRQVRLRGKVRGQFWCHGVQTWRQDDRLEGDITLFDEDRTVFAEVLGVRAQALTRKTHDELQDLDRWLYEFSWEKQPMPPSDGDTGRWLVFADGHGIAEALVQQLLSAGAEAVVKVLPGEAYAVEPACFRIRPDNKSDMECLLDAAAGAGLDRVAYLWGMDVPANGEDPVGTARVVPALHLIQGLAQRSDMRKRGVFIVTCQAEPDHPGTGSTALAQATLVGLLRVTANEYPELRCRVIDLDGTAQTLALLAAEMLSESREEEVVLAGGERYVHRLVRTPAHGMAKPGEQATYRKPQPSGVAITRGPFIPNGAGVTAALPDDMTSLPAFVGAWHALQYHARLQAGENVLVHGADDPVGLAAVHVARWAGSRVHATTRGAVWRDHLRSLGVEEVLDCNHIESTDSLREKVVGGFDVVLNTLSGESAHQAFALLAPFGRLLDVRNTANARLEVGPPLGPNQSVTRIDVDELLRRRPELGQQFLSEVRERFPLADAMPLSTSMPLLSLGENEVGVASNRTRATELFQADGTYLITGGFGGFGLEIAKWMVAQGARYLVLVGRRGANTPESQVAMAELAEAGAHVHPVAADISREADVKRLLGDIARDMPPLKGVFHAAAVLDDGPINSTDATRVANVMRPKALGAWHLHCHTLDMPLDHFVLFSSMASLLGSPGQVTYVVANVFLDALAHYRRARRLPGISINWGALGEVGMAARYEGVEKYFNRVGIGSFTPSQAVKVFEEILRSNPTQVGAIMIDWQLWGEFTPAWAASPRYHGLMVEGVRGDAGAAEGELLRRLRQLPADKRGQVIAKALTDLVAETLQLPTEQIDHSQSLLNMGVDSLMAIELQTAIERRIGVRVSALELMKGTSLAQLVIHMSSHISPADPEKASAAGLPETDQIMASVTALTDEQVDELIAELTDQDQEESRA